MVKLKNADLIFLEDLIVKCEKECFLMRELYRVASVSNFSYFM